MCSGEYDAHKCSRAWLSQAPWFGEMLESLRPVNAATLFDEPF